MAISVFTNVPSLNAQRNLNNNSAAMAKALQRLSSGMRINTAADDAAGMTISNGLQAQIKGLNQAVRNAGDGLSLLGTAESAMTEQTNLLQRMRELSVQAANDTNNATNRTSLNAEVAQLKNELDRIAKTTSFNGINLLDGTFTNKEVQVGANSGADQRLSMDLLGSRATDLGSAYKLTGTTAATSGATPAAWSDGSITITSNGTTTNIGASTGDGVSTTGAAYSALAKANAINAKFSQTNVSATASTTMTAGSAVGGGTLDGTNKLTINGVDITSGSNPLTIVAGETGAQSLATRINTFSSQTGVVASTNGSGKLSLTAADGRNITLGGMTDSAIATTGLTLASTAGSVTGGAAVGAGTFNAGNALTINGIDIAGGSAASLTLTNGDATDAATLRDLINTKLSGTDITASLDLSNKLVLTSASGADINITTTNNARNISGLTNRGGTEVGKLTLKSANAFSVGGTAATAGGIGTGAFGSAAIDSTETVSTIDLTSKAGANTAIGIIDVALSNISGRRSSVGALTNRLNSAISNLSSAVENASASNSRILDADFAQETAAMSRQQILQQAGVAILSQANQGPQLAMSLLK